MMTNNDEDYGKRNDIIPPELAIHAMRDSGYRNTAYALAELIDNSVQAGAALVEVYCFESTVLVKERRCRRITRIAVLDHGMGMTPAILGLALQFGNGTHLADRSGFGRFGMGLPNSSISQGKRVDVWTWQSGPDNAIYSYLDVDEIISGHMKRIPEPQAKQIPDEWITLSKGLSTTGTLVVWSKFDDERLTWKRAKSTLENTETLVGRMYRKFINNGDLIIRLCAVEDSTIAIERNARVNDPLYLMAPSSTPAPFDQKPMFQKYGEADQVFNIKFRDKTHQVIVRASWALPETNPDDGIDRGAKDYGKHAQKNIGVSIIRAGRELDLDPAWAISYDPRERWWGIEVEFPPELDEIFGVTNNKQAATSFSHMVSFDWKMDAEAGETYPDYKRRIMEDGDTRADLIGIVDYIRDTLAQIRVGLADQTKGRRSGTKRHEEPSVEDRASTKFKERAKAGHETDTDKEAFTEKAKEELVTNLVDEKKYSEPAAKEIANAVQLRGRKVIFVVVTSDMDAFFSVEQRPGGITEIVFNRSHPAYDCLVKTLDSDITNATDRDLVSRIQNASDTLYMLFAAWARQEIEDVPGREKLRRMRQDWGRMAQDFLKDEREE